MVASNKPKRSTERIDITPQSTIGSEVADGTLVRRHQLIGWWSLLVFLTLGILLESFHGFKLAWYLAVDSETRRLMWTLAHTHGTLISLIHLAFAYTGSLALNRPSRLLSVASWSMTGALLLMPLGFLLGGTFHYSGDPGLGILLVPPGAALLFLAVLLVAIDVTRHSRV